MSYQTKDGETQKKRKEAVKWQQVESNNRDRDRNRDRDTRRQTDRQTDRQTETERDRKTEPE